MNFKLIIHFSQTAFGLVGNDSLFDGSDPIEATWRLCWVAEIDNSLAVSQVFTRFSGLSSLFGTWGASFGEFLLLSRMGFDLCEAPLYNGLVPYSDIGGMSDEYW